MELFSKRPTEKFSGKQPCQKTAKSRKTANLAAMGVARGVRGEIYFEILHFSVTFLAKKVVFLVSRKKNELSPLLPVHRCIFKATFGKIHYFPPLEKILPTPMLATLFNSHARRNAYSLNLNWTFKYSLSCYCYVITIKTLNKDQQQINLLASFAACLTRQRSVH